MSDSTPASERNRVFLRLLAGRATFNPSYVGWALRKYAESEAEALPQILSRLGVEGDAGCDLMVSLRPMGDRFAEMVQAIAARFGVDALALASVLRHAEVLTALRGGQVASAESGVLLAARMRDADQRRSTARGAEGGPAGKAGPLTGALGEGANHPGDTGDAHEGSEDDDES